MEYVIKEKAKRDLELIWLYTYDQWGATQADSYIGQLIQRISWLAKNPQLGKRRTDIHPEFLCFPEGKHHIFYVKRQLVEIIGIPHQQMDIVIYFDKP
jgi:toxin ParE1/3/4